MRTTSRRNRAPGTGAALIAAGLAVAVGLVACGGASATLTPTTPPPPPTSSPDRHIRGSIDPNKVFQILASGGLVVNQESLSSTAQGEPVQVLFVRDGFQPLTIAQFSNAAAVAEAGYKRGTKLVKGDSPYTFWAGNIVIHYGPRDTNSWPGAPGPDLQAEALKIVAIIDPYMGPLQQRSVVPVALPSTPEPTVEPSTAPTPKPSAKPAAKPTPKPTRH
jgi:hypothetical protein